MSAAQSPWGQADPSHLSSPANGDYIDLTGDTDLTTSPRASDIPSLQEYDDFSEESESADGSVVFDGTRSKSFCVEVPSSTLVSPMSAYDGFVPPLPPVKERIAMAALMDSIESRDGAKQEEWTEFILDRFCFFVQYKHYEGEMRPLHHLATKLGHDKYVVNGILTSLDGKVKHYTSHIAVSELPIGNYGIESDSVNDQIWIRSKLNAKRDVYYRLRTPAPEYERFWTPFLWVANLAKYVVDFCAEMTRHNREVSLSSFKRDFIQWAIKTYRASPSLDRWRREHKSDDYRSSVVANIDFIWKEAYGILPPGVAKSLQLFSEAKQFNRFRKATPRPTTMIVAGDETAPATTVTPYIK